ncbi:hypothetical protein Trydic_g8714 [Trypoxylus dichotomus]
MWEGRWGGGTSFNYLVEEHIEPRNARAQRRESLLCDAMHDGKISSDLLSALIFGEPVKRSSADNASSSAPPLRPRSTC